MSDYVRGGGQVAWWLSGSSILMAGISAFTFTGNASAAFEAGPTVLIIYAANVTAMLICGLFLGAWYRQTRAYTPADVVKSRFSVAVEQFSAYTGILIAPFAAGIQLWALSVFASSTFGVPIEYCIFVIGAVVVFYSTTGGKWAVMATDFVQSLILLSITILVAVLCYHKIGGLSEFFGYFSEPEFAEDFKFVKDPDQWADGKFSFQWIVVIFIMTIYHQITLASAARFLVVKDGKAASKSAYLGAILMAIGSLIWFFPPMVARFLYGDEIMAQAIENPENSSYSYIAQKVLPNGLMGVMIAAMFAATMSSMDSGLNMQVGALVRNIVPKVREMFGVTKKMTPKGELRLCKISTIGIGCLIITYSYLFSQNKELALFDAYLMINSIITIPLVFPMLVGFWVKKLPSWSYFVMFGFCLLPSIYSFWLKETTGEGFTIQQRAMWIFIYGIIGALVCMPFYRRTSDAYKRKVEDFYKLIRTPIRDDEHEGVSRAYGQLVLLGRSSVGVGLALLLLLFVPNELAGILSVLFISGFCAGIGVLLLWAARVEKRKEEQGSE
ncbi:sodium:solute symporter family transporter [Pelagicoccus mobilis]|uniref:sodium:solute symporter family transporter n=1 Tax=Pelagicoccus mobilis TaxID=415221 RepID=UPI0035ED56B9